MQAAAWFRVTNGLIVTLLVTSAGCSSGGSERELPVTCVTCRRPFSSCSIFPFSLAAPCCSPCRTTVQRASWRSSAPSYAVTPAGMPPASCSVSIPSRRSYPRARRGKGLAGSAIACALCGGLIMSLTFHQPWWQGVLFGLAIALTATLGDLGESMIKRDLGLKDMGRRAARPRGNHGSAGLAASVRRCRLPIAVRLPGELVGGAARFPRDPDRGPIIVAPPGPPRP